MRDCHSVYVIDEGSEICQNCGSTQDGVDKNVELRVGGYGTDLVRLQERLEFAYGEPISTRGDRLPEDEYRAWLYTLLQGKVLVWSDQLIPGMSQADFNDPADMQTRQAWTALLQLAHETIDIALDTKARPGPPQLVATHRVLISGLLLFSSAVIGFLSTLTAPTLPVAQRRMNEAQRMLDDSGDLLGKACRFMTDDNSEPESTSAGRAAAEVFDELGSIADSDPVMLRPLLPMARLARQGHDAARRAVRADTVVALCTQATAVAPQWTDPFDMFLGNCSIAWRKIVSQHDRLTRLLADQRSRPGWVDDALDIASKLTEGPFRSYGALLLMAIKVVAGDETSVTEESLARYKSFSKVRRTLADSHGVMVEGVEALVRNAEAHYDYIQRDNGIEIRHLPPRDGSPPQTDFLSFDDLLTTILNLHELSLSMSIGIMRWVWETGHVQSRERFRREWLAS
jgi:hypothetical protein